MDDYAQTGRARAHPRCPLADQGLDGHVDPLKGGSPPALPVVTVNGGFWQTEGSLREQVIRAKSEVHAGEFDQCRSPRLGD